MPNTKNEKGSEDETHLRYLFSKMKDKHNIAECHDDRVVPIIYL